MADEKGTAQVSQVQITLVLGDNKVPQSQIDELSVVSELDHPDSCAITLNKSGVSAQSAKLVLTDPVTVKLAHQGDKDDFAFKGELSGMEPIFFRGSSSDGSMVLRALNAMHALSRGKRSAMYGGTGSKISETDIIERVAKQNGLKVDFGGAPPNELQYDHVYQHNQTDLEFLRWRAARIGYYVLVQDKTLLVRKRSGTPSELKLQYEAVRASGDEKAPIKLDRFVPRLSTANQVTEVRVRSWQPEKRKQLQCTAKAEEAAVPPKLGEITGTKATAQKHSDAALVRVDIPFSSEAEGKALAISLLNERLLSYVTAEGSTPGDSSLKAGSIVTVKVGDARFDGKYLLTYVRHWYRHDGKESRFTTDFRARRDAINPPKTESSTVA